MSDSLWRHGPQHARIPSFTISQNLLRLMSIESMMPSNSLILCCPHSPPALSHSQYQDLFQWVSSSKQVTKVLELEHQSCQGIFRTDFLYNWLVWSPCCPKDSQESSLTLQFESIDSSWVQTLGQEDPLEKGMANCSSILAWRIPWTEEPGGLRSMGLQRVGHDWVTNTHVLF